MYVISKKENADCATFNILNHIHQKFGWFENRYTLIVLHLFQSWFFPQNSFHHHNHHYLPDSDQTSWPVRRWVIIIIIYCQSHIFYAPVTAVVQCTPSSQGDIKSSHNGCLSMQTVMFKMSNQEIIWHQPDCDDFSDLKGFSWRSLGIFFLHLKKKEKTKTRISVLMLSW